MSATRLRSSLYRTLSPGVMIEVPHDVRDRIVHDTGLSASQVLASVRSHGVYLPGMDQDGSLKALVRTLAQQGVPMSEILETSIADLIGEVDRRMLYVYYPDHVYLLYAFYCPVRMEDSIAMFRAYPQGRMVLHDVAPRVKSHGVPWDWFGVRPDPRAFELSKRLAERNVPAATPP